MSSSNLDQIEKAYDVLHETLMKTIDNHPEINFHAWLQSIWSFLMNAYVISDVKPEEFIKILQARSNLYSAAFEDDKIDL